MDLLTKLCGSHRFSAGNLTLHILVQQGAQYWENQWWHCQVSIANWSVPQVANRQLAFGNWQPSEFLVHDRRTYDDSLLSQIEEAAQLERPLLENTAGLC